jgi:hypothetical protein
MAAENNNSRESWTGSSVDNSHSKSRLANSNYNNSSNKSTTSGLHSIFHLMQNEERLKEFNPRVNFCSKYVKPFNGAKKNPF